VLNAYLCRPFPVGAGTARLQEWLGLFGIEMGCDRADEIGCVGRGKEGITVNCVEPGLVDTALTRNPGRWKEALKEGGKEAKENPTEQEVIAARLPQSVMGIPWMPPDEVAPAVIFLCTNAANRISGATYDATAGDSVKFTA
jgi:hypothetical protein